jgi:hypothetical protein
LAYIEAEYGDLDNPKFSYCLRNDKYKFIHNEDKPDELYNLLKDPYENKNIINIDLNAKKYFYKQLNRILREREKNKISLGIKNFLKTRN